MHRAEGFDVQFQLQAQVAVVVLTAVEKARQRIGALLDDPSARARMGVAGRAWMLEMFTWDRVIARMIACYQQVLGETLSKP